MNKKLNVGILFGGRSGEHEVSLASAQSILDAIDKTKYEIIPIGITLDGKWLIGNDILEKIKNNDIASLTPVILSPYPGDNFLYALHDYASKNCLQPVKEIDVFFPVLHGTFGEDGTLQGLLELTDVAYVGAGVLGSAAGMDKALFKDVMRANNIPVVESLLFTREQVEIETDSVWIKIEETLPYPIFVKPANLGSSVGITKCRNRSDLIEGLMDAALYDRRVLVERGIDAREIEISVLGNENPEASIPGEICPRQDFYSYNAKYIDNSTDLIIPAPLPDDFALSLCDLAIRAYQAIDCAGMARVDFLIEKSTNKIYVNELNTIPGFTNISMYPKLWEVSGLPYTKLIDRLIELALKRKLDRDRTLRKYRSEG